MPVFDADGHIFESHAMFSDSYLDPEFRDRRPYAVTVDGCPRWVVDSQIFPRWTGRGCLILGTPVEHEGARAPAFAASAESLGSLELTNPASRLRAMDAEGIDRQAIYPSLFLAPLTPDDRYAAGLARAYNRWLAEQCAGSDRLDAVSFVPLGDVPAAVEEVRAAKRNGAIGLCILGTVGERTLDRPELLPFFEAAAEEDLPIGVHIGWSWPALNNLYDNMYFSASLAFTMPVLLGFAAIVGGGILDRFPSLRVSFLEAGCLWLHFLTDRLEHRFAVVNRMADQRHEIQRPPAKRNPLEYLRSGRLFINAEIEDPLLPQVINLIGEDQILWASDMPHGNRELHAAREFLAREDLPEPAKQKILWDNTFRYYGLPIPSTTERGGIDPHSVNRSEEG